MRIGYKSSSEKKDWPSGRCRRASHYCWKVIPPGFINIEGPLLGGGAFYWGVSEDDVYLSVLNEGDAQVFVYGLGYLCILTFEGSLGLRINSQRYP